MYATYAAQHPGKAAALAVKLLESADARDLERGQQVAAALRGADRCAVCGRPLEVLASRQAGIGPDCLAKRRSHAARALAALRGAGFDVLDLDLDIEEDPQL